MTTPEPKPQDLSRDIAQLADADEARRETAAGRIYARGAGLARPFLARCRKHPGLAALVRLRGSAHPLGMTVGVAVCPGTFERIHGACGRPRMAEVPPDQDAREFELHFGSGASLDILTTREPGGAGAIGRFLEKFGEGIQQVELLAADVDRAAGELRALGFLPVYPAARAGADGTRVNFFLAPAPRGKKVLIELVECKDR